VFFGRKKLAKTKKHPFLSCSQAGKNERFF